MATKNTTKKANTTKARATRSSPRQAPAVRTLAEHLEALDKNEIANLRRCESDYEEKQIGFTVAALNKIYSVFLPVIRDRLGWSEFQQLLADRKITPAKEKENPWWPVVKLTMGVWGLDSYGQRVFRENPSTKHLPQVLRWAQHNEADQHRFTDWYNKQAGGIDGIVKKARKHFDTRTPEEQRAKEFQEEHLRKFFVENTEPLAVLKASLFPNHQGIHGYMLWTCVGQEMKLWGTVPSTSTDAEKLLVTLGEQAVRDAKAAEATSAAKASAALKRGKAKEETPLIRFPDGAKVSDKKGQGAKTAPAKKAPANKAPAKVAAARRRARAA